MRPVSALSRELLEQIRSDVRAGREIVEATPAPPGVVRLATPHVPTDVRVQDIAQVRQVRPTAATLQHLRGLVELHDGTRLHVPDARAVIEAMAQATRAARSR